MNFNKYTLKQLKEIIKNYNIHTKMKGYSKMTKDVLVTEMKLHLKFNENGDIMAKVVDAILYNNPIEKPAIVKPKRISKKMREWNARQREIDFKNAMIAMAKEERKANPYTTNKAENNLRVGY